MKDEATLAVLDALESIGIPYMVVGSLSTNCMECRGLPRTPISSLEAGSSSILQLGNRLGPQFRLDPQPSFEMVTMTIRYILEVVGISFKIELFRLSDDAHDQERFRRRRRVRLLGREVSMLTVEDVVVTKVRWAVPRPTLQGPRRCAGRDRHPERPHRLGLRQRLVRPTRLPCDPRRDPPVNSADMRRQGSAMTLLALPALGPGPVHPRPALPAARSRAGTGSGSERPRADPAEPPRLHRPAARPGRAVARAEAAADGLRGHVPQPAPVAVHETAQRPAGAGPQRAGQHPGARTGRNGGPCRHRRSEKGRELHPLAFRPHPAPRRRGAGRRAGADRHFAGGAGSDRRSRAHQRRLGQHVQLRPDGPGAEPDAVAVLRRRPAPRQSPLLRPPAARGRHGGAAGSRPAARIAPREDQPLVRGLVQLEGPIAARLRAASFPLRPAPVRLSEAGRPRRSRSEQDQAGDERGRQPSHRGQAASAVGRERADAGNHARPARPRQPRPRGGDAPGGAAVRLLRRGGAGQPRPDVGAGAGPRREGDGQAAARRVVPADRRRLAAGDPGRHDPRGVRDAGAWRRPRTWRPRTTWPAC